MILARIGRATPLVGIVAVLGMLDYWSGPDFGFSLFYLLPVGLTAWQSPGVMSVLLACLSGLAWLAADVPYHGLTAVSVWNGFTRLTMYVALAVLTGRVRRDRDNLASLNRQLQTLLAREQELARTDILTGLPNSRMFDDGLRSAIARHRRLHKPMAVGYFDLDNFKRLNDTRGHGAGDDALRTVAACLTSVMRSSDLAARIGGDEFAVLFSDCDEPAAQAAGSRIMAAVDLALQTIPSEGLGMTGGIACFAEPPADPRAILDAADRVLYEAKSAGKRRLDVKQA